MKKIMRKTILFLKKNVTEVVFLRLFKKKAVARMKIV